MNILIVLFVCLVTIAFVIMARKQKRETVYRKALAVELRRFQLKTRTKIKCVDDDNDELEDKLEEIDKALKAPDVDTSQLESDIASLKSELSAMSGLIVMMQAQFFSESPFMKTDCILKDKCK